MMIFRCTVCGYLHEGEEPPERCPICGAPKEKFVRVSEEVDETKKENEDLEIGEEFLADIVVVGSGAAAFSAAVTARSLGASVIMLEKASHLGGTTARSGGGYWIPLNPFQEEAGIKDNKEDCLKYMARYSYPHLYDPAKERLGLPTNEYALIEAYVDHASSAIEYFEEKGALHSIMEINWTGKPQVDYVDHLSENKGIRGRSLYPRDKDGKQSYGPELIAQMENWAKTHDIDIRTDVEVKKIITDSTDKVIGVEGVHKNARKDFYFARKGVIFGSGGYSHNSEYMLHFQRGPHFGGCSVPTNTGDFIKEAGAIGAKLGNMAGAFRAQSMIEAYLENPAGSSNVFYLAGDSVLVVNKYGERVMDEKRNYTDRAMTHFIWDPQRAEWTNLLMCMIFDQRTATLWQGFPPYPTGDEMPSYLIKGETLEELEKEIKARLAKLSSQTGDFALEPTFLEGLKNTIERFNGFATSGVDKDFNRGDYAYDREWTTFPPTVPNVKWPEEGSKNYTMYPLNKEGPFYAILLGAGTLDTNGGPIINEKAQVLAWNDTPIKGLYGAGNCIASPTANAYWGAGSTIGPALTFGYLAGKHAVENGDKKEE